MKYVFFLFIFIFIIASPSSFSETINCPQDYDKVFRMILETNGSCEQSFRLGDACRMGSSADTQISNAINIVCNEELEHLKPSKERQDELAHCRKLCIEKYIHEEGTLSISLRSFCYSEQGRRLVEILNEESTRTKPGKKRKICEPDEDIPLS